MSIQMSDMFALGAVLVSVLAIWISLRTHAESSAANTIWSQYERFSRIVQTQIENSQFSHLFVVPETYPAMLSQVTASVEDLSPQERLRLELQERAMADYILNEFELSFYQINRARPRFDKQSKEFFEEVLAYFTQRLLRNPRLLYYWSRDGGQLCLNYEPSTIEYYERRVLNDPSHPIVMAPDPIGPFTGSLSAPRKNTAGDVA